MKCETFSRIRVDRKSCKKKMSDRLKIEYGLNGKVCSKKGKLVMDKLYLS